MASVKDINMKRMYDPPTGWRYGFPKEYKPLEGETLADTLRRDGYPESMDPEWASNHTRFWTSDDEPKVQTYE